MIIINTFMALCLLLLPFLAVKKAAKSAFYKNDHDTTNARYAVNSNGYLEEIANDKVQDVD